jgi:peptide-methionine (S)-S-oxide reductase
MMFPQKISWLFTVGMLGFAMLSCAQNKRSDMGKASAATASGVSVQLSNSDPDMELATFGAGCFWCVEAVFQRLEGVKSVVSGYTGGHVKNPSYEAVCRGTTGHAEVCQIAYDPKVISFEELLEVFWQTHDPTTLNRQGNDVGPQYRSAIFYHNDNQRQLAEQYKKAIDQSGAWGKPIVTEITALDVFYPAEDYHQNYYNRNSTQSYCAFVIAPKVDKLKKVFADKLKKENK